MDAATTKIVTKAYVELQAAEEKIKACGNVLKAVLGGDAIRSPKRNNYKEQFQTSGKISKPKK